MDIAPKIIYGNVMHKRLFPKTNQFNYKIYYLSLPLSQINQKIEHQFFKINRWGLLSFYNKDHGNRDGTDLNQWAQDILQKNKITKANGEIILVTMPRVLGYVFNPVSFWYCYDNNKILRAVICEVNNTFGETHSYICAHQDQSEIKNDDVLTGEKFFHVSPFIERKGQYKFQFINRTDQVKIDINLYDQDNQKLLLTSVSGKNFPLTDNACKKAFWGYPLVTFKSIILIHWQAIKILWKNVSYISKPLQLNTNTTRTQQSEKKSS